VLPAMPGPAFWLNVTVAVIWGCTTMLLGDSTPAGSVAGAA